MWICVYWYACVCVCLCVCMCVCVCAFVYMYVNKCMCICMRIDDVQARAFPRKKSQHYLKACMHAILWSRIKKTYEQVHIHTHWHTCINTVVHGTRSSRKSFGKIFLASGDPFYCTVCMYVCMYVWDTYMYVFEQIILVLGDPFFCTVCMYVCMFVWDTYMYVAGKSSWHWWRFFLYFLYVCMYVCMGYIYVYFWTNHLGIRWPFFL